MNNSVTVALAQLDLVVGDIAGNTARILEYSERAREELSADMVAFPELSVCGYPPCIPTKLANFISSTGPST
jgi:NAD+ synthase (glutamine-hydrolysing)